MQGLCSGGHGEGKKRTQASGGDKPPFSSFLSPATLIIHAALLSTPS